MLLNYHNVLQLKKVLFLHGFTASGSCNMARALRDALVGEAEVFTPDLPLHPDAALQLIRTLCRELHPDLLVGNSCGAFYAQMISAELNIPALLGNPFFMMSSFLKPRVGENKYKSARKDGVQEFLIDNQLIEEFERVEKVQFHQASNAIVWGLFGEQDTLAKFEPLFLEHYKTAFHFPGNHTPTPEETKAFYAPLVRKMLNSPQ